MQVTLDQVHALAPDARSLKGAERTASPSKWSELGTDEIALWGQCKGSGKTPYQVRCDLRTMSFKCSCPSRKFPCKHSLAMLLVVARDPALATAGAAPAWVADWIAARNARAQAAQEKAQAKAAKGVDEGAQAKRQQDRDALISAGVEGLQLWMDDLVRHGLARVESEPDSFFERVAARLVDAQAPGLAGQVRGLAEVVGTGDDWPERMLWRLGRLALLCDAWQRIDELPPDLAEDIRSDVGIRTQRDEVLATQPAVADVWVPWGQIEWQVDDHVTGQRTWLWGQNTGRSALILQFSFRRAAWKTTFVLGRGIDAELHFYPGAEAMRARVGEIRQPATAAPFGHDSVPAFLDDAARISGRHPWAGRVPCVLRGVVPVRDPDGRWFVVDESGSALPLDKHEQWTLASLSAGGAVDVGGEWNGAFLRPLGCFSSEGYTRLFTGWR